MDISEPPSLTPLASILLDDSGAIMAGFGTFGISISFVVLGLLLLSSALISGSEAAFFSLSPTDKENLKNDESKGAEYVRQMLKRPKDLLATILIANNFVNVGIVILSSAILASAYPPTDTNTTIRFIIEVVLITLVLLLLGEVIPKIYATKNALRFSMLMGRSLYFLDRLPPISWIRMSLVKSSALIQRRAKKGKVSVSSDELEQALALTRDDEDPEEEEKHKILEGIVKFGATDVRQIMKSRMDVHAIEAGSTFEEVMETILDCGHSRIPVYRENFDQIIGVLFVKDLLPTITKDNENSVDWLSLVRKPFYVPENKKIDDLLKEFQDKRFHIAMVVDEYGGTSGIVTLEDILEEIVGDITDEFDEDELVYTKIDQDTYLFEGKTSLVDVYKVLDIEEKDLGVENSMADSLSGFIVEKEGRILMNNEFIITGRIKLVVESSDKKRIKMIKAIRLTEITEE